VAGSQLTPVLIDSESSLNLLFVKYTKEDGAEAHKDAHPSKAPFYGIVPGNTDTPIGSMTLPVTFVTEVDVGTSLPSGVRFFRERLCEMTQRTGTWLDGGRGPSGFGSRPNWIAMISCILSDRIPCK
jgi:hypothetical protein